MEGSSTVLIGGKPAARLLDRTACGGGPIDVIIQGSSTVLIGGMPAARQGEATAHGGRILGGEPSVRIGGAAVSLAVDGDPVFVVRTRETLAELLGTRKGKAWLREIAQHGRRVTIAPTDGPTTCLADVEEGESPRWGEPTDSRIRWNPSEIGPEGAEGPGPRRLAGALSKARQYAEGKWYGPEEEEDWLDPFADLPPSEEDDPGAPPAPPP